MEIKSPCISVCVLNDSGDFCLGCYRTGDEIERWGELTNEEKSHLITLIEKRRREMNDTDCMN